MKTSYTEPVRMSIQMRWECISGYDEDRRDGKSRILVAAGVYRMNVSAKEARGYSGERTRLAC